MSLYVSVHSLYGDKENYATHRLSSFTSEDLNGVCSNKKPRVQQMPKGCLNPARSALTNVTNTQTKETSHSAAFIQVPVGVAHFTHFTNEDLTAPLPKSKINKRSSSKKSFNDQFSDQDKTPHQARAVNKDVGCSIGAPVKRKGISKLQPSNVHLKVNLFETTATTEEETMDVNYNELENSVIHGFQNLDDDFLCDDECDYNLNDEEDLVGQKVTTNLQSDGEDGFHKGISYAQTKENKGKTRRECSMMDFYSYRLQVRHNQGMTCRLGGRLFQQYIVDAFSCIEQARLWWFRSHQTTLRSELYNHICDYIREGDGDSSKVGKSFILPAGFVGSRRYMQQNFQDALAVCRYIGHPDIFLTMTSNPLWDEIIQMLKLIPNATSPDNPDIVARVFHLKLQQLLDDIKKFEYFGKCVGVMYVVEFQKRGLPHVHMLIWLDEKSKRNLKENVDDYVSAEIPDPLKDPVGYEAVKSFMMHGPCGAENSKSPCMKDSQCIRHFPKKFCARTMFDESGFPIYKRRNSNVKVKVRKSELDNRKLSGNPNLDLNEESIEYFTLAEIDTLLRSIGKNKIPGDSVSYLSVDTAEEFGGTDAELNLSFPTEYLNSLAIPGHSDINCFFDIVDQSIIMVTTPSHYRLTSFRSYSTDNDKSMHWKR
ncbi:hypothetical protein POM88_050562 [Heracleum sosnowskyi]|uniref:Helitron helicase-like domain-containing protein n=1 Tax=Heracleum sosnowskyi TaxID=360622 RepID=A0AAD8GZ00_9APIA|nr:hypothetical protein POM88_050562 [Heracleum sosnowskyi]